MLAKEKQWLGVAAVTHLYLVLWDQEEGMVAGSPTSAHLGHVAVAMQVEVRRELDRAAVPAVHQAGLAQHDGGHCLEHRAHALRA